MFYTAAQIYSLSLIFTIALGLIHFMAKILSALALARLTLGVISTVQAADLTGKWRTIDDKTGFSKAIVEIKQQSDGSYN